MRVLILTPSVYPGTTGNAVTTERWRRSLTCRGVSVEVLPSDGLTTGVLRRCLRGFAPDLIHVHHAYKTGSLLLDTGVPESALLPLVVSPGGTDINLDLGVTDRRETIREVLKKAKLILVQSYGMTEKIREQMPDFSDKIVSVPKAFAWFGDEFYDLRAIAGCGREDLLFFLPAGIRPVKGNVECLLAFERLHGLRPNVRLVNAGPAVDPEYSRRFERELTRMSSFARWIGPIAPARMRSAYEGSDIVLNTSFSEGLSNSILEAISAERPILASDIPGNRQPVIGETGDPPAGLLYSPGDPDDFMKKALELIDSPESRKKLGQASKMRKTAIPGPDEEAQGLIEAYQRALAEP